MMLSIRRLSRLDDPRVVDKFMIFALFFQHWLFSFFFLVKYQHNTLVSAIKNTGHKPVHRAAGCFSTHFSFLYEPLSIQLSNMTIQLEP